jgi:hypothetical protein
MSNIAELRDSIQDLTAQELLRFLITEKFPGRQPRVSSQPRFTPWPAAHP